MNPRPDCLVCHTGRYAGQTVRYVGRARNHAWIYADISGDTRIYRTDTGGYCTEHDITPGISVFWGDCNVITLSVECVQDCTRPGPADDMARYHCESDLVEYQLDQVTEDAIRAELSEYGAWDTEELEDSDMNRERLLWVLCGNALDYAAC